MYKTIADYTKINTPEYVDGESLVPIVKDQSVKLEDPTIITWGRGNYSVRTKDYRYIRYFDGGEELYNHLEDPNEWKNLANDEAYTSLKNELKSHLPKEEQATVTDYLSIWSVEGADKSKYRGKNNNTNQKKKKKK